MSDTDTPGPPKPGSPSSPKPTVHSPPARLSVSNIVPRSPIAHSNHRSSVAVRSDSSSRDDARSRLSPSVPPDDDQYQQLVLSQALSDGSTDVDNELGRHRTGVSIYEGRDEWEAYADGEELLRVSNDDLQEAALRGDLGLVRRLVQAGASVNAPVRPESDDEFMVLLHVLARKPEMMNGTRIIAEIVRNRANLNVRSSLGSTPLSFACLSKHIGAVEVLLGAKANPSPIDDWGRRAIFCAVLPPVPDVPESESLCVEVIQLLTRARANLDDGGNTPPILEAVRRKSESVVNALIVGGAEADGLHDAVRDGPLPIIQALIDAEVNPFKKDSKGRTAMDLASARGDETVTSLLKHFIGDLQRKGHQHLKTMEQVMKEDALKKLEISSSGGRSESSMGTNRPSGVRGGRKPSSDHSPTSQMSWWSGGST